MSDALTREEVERIAALASLALTPDEIDTFVKQLAEILAYARLVQQIDTTGIPPTSHGITMTPVDRDDELRPSLDREEALAAAPDGAPHAGLFRVPRVIG